MRAHNRRLLAEEKAQAARAEASEVWLRARTPEEKQAAYRLMSEADRLDAEAEALPASEYFCASCHQVKDRLEKVIKTIAGYSRFDSEGECIEQVTYPKEEMRTEYICPGCDERGQVSEYLQVKEFSEDLTTRFPAKRITKR
jgi:hypothetical protein